MENVKPYGQIEKLPGDKSGICWTGKERPTVNHWYRVRGDGDADYWKIVKDFYSPELKTTFYKIVEYYNGDNLYTGHSLAGLRAIMREHTYRMVI